MKYTIALVVLFILGTNVSAKEVIQLKGKTSVELNYEEFKIYSVQIKNKSLKGIDVSVTDALSKEWVKGFGLSAKGKAVVDVQPEQVLILTNETDQDIDVVLDFVERKVFNENSESISSESITFILHNSSAKSIPLIIPAVMNPNLSPFSDSGVKLKVGQKIYYRKNGKKKLLLIVDKTIKEGEKIDVAKRIRKLEKES